ncbi:hypothetical protein DF17_24105 [Streptomyces rimosus]|nr:hypothetical protein DF17_24105 [Streptomyces rimosus]
MALSGVIWLPVPSVRPPGPSTAASRGSAPPSANAASETAPAAAAANRRRCGAERSVSWIRNPRERGCRGTAPMAWAPDGA